MKPKIIMTRLGLWPREEVTRYRTAYRVTIVVTITVVILGLAFIIWNI